jgi:hypothetical protein
MSYDGPERRIDNLRHEEQIDRLNHVVFGNGEPGLAENYRALKTMVDSITSDVRESKLARRQIAIGVIIGVVVATLNLVMTLMRHV